MRELYSILLGGCVVMALPCCNKQPAEQSTEPEVKKHKKAKVSQGGLTYRDDYRDEGQLPTTPKKVAYYQVINPALCNGNARIELPYGESSTIYSHETMVLPVWKREPLRLIAQEREAIKQAGNKEAIPIRKLSPADQQKWLQQWNAKNQPLLRKLEKREHLIKQWPKPPKVKDSEKDAMFSRLRDDSPVFRESDMHVIAAMIPSYIDWAKPPQTGSSETDQLILVYQELARRFPVSVSKKHRF